MRVPTPKHSNRRIYELDVLRGLAALGVVLYHYTTRYDQIYGHSHNLLLSFPQGRYGVPMFFMISGFVILLALERTKRILDFVVGRIARLYPVYWVAIALTFTTVALVGLPGREVSINDAIVNLSMIQRFMRIPDVDGVYWTLQVELIFYLVMVLLYQLRLLRHIETMAIAWLLINLVRIQSDWLPIPAPISPFFLTDYAHFFIIGIALYQIWNKGGSTVRYGLIAAGLLVHAMNSHAESIIACMGFALGLFFAIHGYLRFIAVKPLIFLGTISYSLYLIHQNIGYIVIRTLSQVSLNAHLSITVALGVSIGLASVMALAIERPTMRYLRTLYRDKIDESTRPPQPAPNPLPTHPYPSEELPSSELHR